MKFIDKQLIGFALQALYRHAEIVSGAYKLRETQVGVERKDFEKYKALGLLSQETIDAAQSAGTFPFRDLTDDEKLQDSLGIMQTQIRWVQQCIDGPRSVASDDEDDQDAEHA